MQSHYLIDIQLERGLDRRLEARSLRLHRVVPGFISVTTYSPALFVSIFFSAFV